VQSLDDLVSELISGDDQRAESAIVSLSHMGESALEAIIKLLESPDPDHRWWAVRTLSNFKSPLIGDFLKRALYDSDCAVRHCAALCLRHSPHVKAIPALIEAFGDKDRLFARLAGDALASIGKPAIPALTDAIQSQNPAIRGEAARALAKMKEPDTLPILYSVNEDPSAIVQYWVEEGFQLQGVGMVFFKP
jgi:HEAT repeat protein